MEILILLAVVVPAAGTVITIFGMRKWVALFCSGISLGLLCMLVPQAAEPVEITYQMQMNPLQIRVIVDALSLLFAFLVSLLFLMAIIYSRRESSSYYFLLLCNLAVLLGIAFSNELLLFYVFLEMSAVITYFLVIHKQTDESIAAGFKYLVMNMGGAVFVLLGILLKGDSLGALLFIAGCLVKAGSFPVHVWLADAHPAAPSAVSALLSGAVVKTGVYGILRFAPAFAVDVSVVIPLALASMLLGVFLALLQTDVKRILAYSTISQVGFVLLGLGLQSTAGISGGILHMVNHGIFKALLFLCMGCVIKATGERNLHHLGGLKSKMPLTAAACLIGALSISGIPPFNGFVSKTILFHGVESDTVKMLFVITCAGTVASFIKLFRHTFLLNPGVSPKKIPASMKLPLIILSGFCIVLGVIPSIVLSFTGYTFEFQLTECATEILVTVGLGSAIYWIGLKTGVITNPPHLRVSIDRIICGMGKITDYSSSVLSNVLTQDINYYATYMVVFLVLLFFLFTL